MEIQVGVLFVLGILKPEMAAFDIKMDSSYQISILGRG